MLLLLCKEFAGKQQVRVFIGEMDLPQGGNLPAIGQEHMVQRRGKGIGRLLCTLLQKLMETAYDALSLEEHPLGLLQLDQVEQVVLLVVNPQKPFKGKAHILLLGDIPLIQHHLVFHRGGVHVHQVQQRHVARL